MFGTLIVGSERKSLEFIEHAKGEAASRLGGYVFSHSACENCRLKKLRCSGHRTGCDRCRSQALRCSYQTATESSSSRPKSNSNSQNNLSNTAPTLNTSGAPIPLDDSGVNQDIGGWEMAETDPTGSVATTAGQFTQNLNHANQGEHSNLDDLRPGMGFGGELDYSEKELDDFFGNVGGFQPDQMQTDVCKGTTDGALLDAEAFDSMAETPSSMLDDMSDIVLPQPAVAGARSSRIASNLARTSRSSSSCQNSGASASDDFVATSFGPARSRTDSSSCQCRTSILRVLAEIDLTVLSASPTNMYTILSYQRRTTAASNDILTSRICNCRIKFFGLLGIIAEKITSLAEAIIAAFVCRVKEQNDSVDCGVSASPDKHIDRKSAIRLEEFQVQTLQEFKVVSAALIKLQLKYSVAFVARTRELAMSMDRLAQAQTLRKLESRLKDVFMKMQRMASDVEADCHI